jgi:hypothetical protein
MINATAMRPGLVVSKFEDILLTISFGSPSLPRNGSLELSDLLIGESKERFEASAIILATMVQASTSPPFHLESFSF